LKKIKRSQFVIFYFYDGQFLDIVDLLHGNIKLDKISQIFAISILKGKEYPISLNELNTLRTIPSDKWVSYTTLQKKFKISNKNIDEFISKGLLLSNENTKTKVNLKNKHEKLISNQWNIYAAIYHFMTKWEDLHLKIDLPKNLEELTEVTSATNETFEQFIKHFGKPPTHFVEVKSSAVQKLPLIKRNSELYRTLLKRKTTRAFDIKKSMKIEDLSIILYYVFGVHGYSPIFKDIIGLKKTSPSGGDLHPTEVYPLIIKVKGIISGLYHYNIKNHSLELLQKLKIDEARELANEFTAGQSYPRWAHVLFIMTSRYYRNYWKYRRHEKAYSVLQMDVGHLSQTFYLVCTDLRLGAFITGAINSINIENKLGLDGIDEGATAICGCGIPTKTIDLDPNFIPYTPRKTKI